MTETKSSRPFLNARWEHLLMLNYRCPAEILAPLTPIGLELDDWEGESLISIVGFMFADTHVAGRAWPGHTAFEEVNLRFYVRRECEDQTRRGVVFIRELVPKPIIAIVASYFYDEPYLTAAMSHESTLHPDSGGSIAYRWRLQGQQFTLGGSVSGPAKPLEGGSHAEFITEHYWGYTRRRDGTTSEYQVSHPRWHVWDCDSACFAGAPRTLYGEAIGKLLEEPPVSALLALGSDVTVYRGHRLS